LRSIQFSARVSSPSVLREESYGREGGREGEFYGRENLGGQSFFNDVFDPIEFFWRENFGRENTAIRHVVYNIT
jgi:hypothetical protein